MITNTEESEWTCPSPRCTWTSTGLPAQWMEAAEVTNETPEFDGFDDDEDAVAQAEVDDAEVDDDESDEVDDLDDADEPAQATGVDEADAVDAAGAVDAAPEVLDVVEEFKRELRMLPGDWYVIHSYAGYENRVKTNLESRIMSLNMEDYI